MHSRSGALAVALLLGLAGAASGQENQEQMKKNRDALLAEGWLKKADWITDYDKALAEAKKSGKAIFAYFTRSYAT
jgi:hypothetical protein